MSKLNYSISDASAASKISGPREPMPIELESMMETINQFFKDCGSEDYMAYKNGICKNANAAFKPSTFLKNLNLILYNNLKEHNKDNVQLLKDYFNSLNSQLSLLDSMNLNMSDKQFICNIIGYALNCYKNNTFKKP